MQPKEEIVLTRLEKENQELKEKIFKLEQVIGDLVVTNKKLLEENQILKERLGLNSSNSSLPPSRDLYKQNKENKPLSARNPGGQPGHQAHQYQAMQPTKVIDLLPTARCNCGDEVEISEDYTKEQRIEIPPIKPEVIEYRRWQGRCRKCGKKAIASLPPEAGKDLLGPRAKAIIATLNGCYHNSKREVKEILEEIFDLSLSLGLITKTTQRVKEKLNKNQQAIEEVIKGSPYLHIDETGHKSQGKRGWAWIYTTHSHSLLKLSLSRGKKELASTIGNYGGYVVSDRYGVYNYFKEEQRQICWSHLLRDYQRLAQSLNPKLSEQGRRLVAVGKEVFFINKALKNKQIDLLFFLRRIKKLKKEIKNIFKFILRIRDIPQAHRVVKRMLKSFEMMWLFVKKQGIDMTNNLAERQIRKYVIYRKKLLFTWSDWGNQFVERILSLYLTCRLNKANVFTHLLHAIAPQQYGL